MLLNRPFLPSPRQPLPLAEAARTRWAAAWTKKGMDARHSGQTSCVSFPSFPFELVKELFLNVHGSPELVVSALFFFSTLILWSKCAIFLVSVLL